MVPFVPGKNPICQLWLAGQSTESKPLPRSAQDKPAGEFLSAVVGASLPEMHVLFKDAHELTDAEPPLAVGRPQTCHQEH